MDAALVFAIVLAVAFAITNGFHDAANSIAALVATRAATPLQAIVLASVFNLLGPLLLGAAVANTIGGIVTVAPSAADQVIGSGLAAAVSWNLATWSRGLPSSSAQALVGGLVGAALAEGGLDAVNWGGVHEGHPVGVLGTLMSLAISPPLGALAALLVIRGLRRLARRATRRWAAPVRGGQWATAAALSFSHGANDAQKAVGVIAALLLADGRIRTLTAPSWVIVVCATALTVGTALGGWRIIRTVGRGIYRIQRIEGLASTGASAAVIFGASLAGAPTSTSQVVASSVVGVGGGRWRWRHVHWEVVRHVGVAWLITLPSAGLLGAAVFGIWHGLT
ncbi:MAG TPA: inorganic phosphate transporter [Solirubrobacteraceae bacterium]|nr:inorganic phosphate transporter [Solirubrobacteraceae bacterium]